MDLELISSNTGSPEPGLVVGDGSAVRITVAPCGMAVERSLGVGTRWICVSSFLISDSSAAIWSLSVRARAEIGSAFFFDDAIQNKFLIYDLRFTIFSKMRAI